MSNRRFKIWIGTSVLVGTCLFAAPWAMLLFSDKSPLRSHDAAYINGFGLGIGFVGFMLIGAWCFVGAIAAYRRRSDRRQPEP